MQRLIILLFFLAVLADESGGQTLKALFDNTKNETAGNSDWIIDDTQPIPSPAQSGITQSTAENYWLGAISAWGVDLVKRGFVVHTLTSSYGITYGNSSNPYDLSNYNLFIVCEPQDPFSSAEKLAIKSFVQNGGGLCMVADHNGSDRNSNGWDSPQVWNDLRTDSLFGIHFQSTSETNNNITEVSSNLETGPDSIITGPAGTVTALSYHNGTTMRLLTSVNANAQAHVWMTSATHGAAQVMAATSRYGAGKVAGVGDSSPADDGSAQPGNSSIYDGWTESGSTDNILFLNLCLWLATPGGPPSQVQPVSPSDGSTAIITPVIFKWRQDAASAYQLDVSTSSAFGTLFFSDSALTDTLKGVGAALNTTYYWRVRAKNGAGWGVYSSTRSFTTWDVPPQTQLRSPADSSTDIQTSATLTWSKTPTATNFQLDVSTVNTFATLAFRDTTLTDTIGTVALSLNTSYYWRVRAKNGAGWGQFSPVRLFTTWNVPPAVQPVYPDDGATDLPPSLTIIWRALSVSLYQLDVSVSNSFSSYVLHDSTITDTSKGVSLPSGSTYYWRVRGKNPAGWGPFGSTRSFSTWPVPGQPQLLSPAEGAQNVSTPTSLVWSSDAAATNYELDVSDASSFSTLSYADTSLVDTSHEIQLSLGLTAYWRVRGKNAHGWGPYSNPRHFTTWDVPPQVLLIAPSDSMLTPTPTSFRWHAAAQATKYRLDIALSPGFSSLLVSDSSLTDTVTVESLSLGSAYYWRVTAWNGAGWGVSSDVRYFRTWNVPTQLILSQPQDSAVNPGTCSWIAQANSTSYELEISDTANFVRLISDSTLTDTTLILPALPSERYYWRGRARNGAGWGNYSTVRTFVIAQPPLPPVLASPPNGSSGLSSPTTFLWHGVASFFEVQLSEDPSFGSSFGDSSITDTSKSLSGLDSTVTYYWRVRGKNAYGWGAYSAPWRFIIRLSVTETTTVSKGWNLLSVPGEGLPKTRTGLFPAARSRAFTFAGFYVPEETLSTGPGFWLKFDSTQLVSVSGTAMLHDSVVLRKGWNLVGAGSDPTQADSISTSPAGILESHFYGYDGRYYIAPILMPFKGYWVKASREGALFLRGRASASKPELRR